MTKQCVVTWTTMKVAVQSDEIASVTLHKERALVFHLYVFPFLFLYPALAYAYYGAYDRYIQSEEWTFVFTVLLTTTHALSFLVTRWSVRAHRVRIVPHAHKGEGGMVPLRRVKREGERDEFSFVSQADKYVLAVPDSSAPVTSITASPDIREPTFRRLLYPADVHPPLSHFQKSNGLDTEGVVHARKLYGDNVLEIPVPKFWDLFAEHAVAPFFVFQIFCSGLWMLDEYWWSSLFSLVALVAFECTVVFQRQRTLNEFRTMSIQPFTVNVYRNHKWLETSTSDLLPGDVVSIVRTKEDSAVPCDVLLLSGSSIVNEAMLSGESTPLLKEGIAQRDPNDTLDDQDTDRLHCLFGGTKALQVSPGGGVKGIAPPPDGGAIGSVLRTAFGTTQGRLVRLMVFTNENQVTANNWESFVFIAFLLVFAIAASAYVWVNGLEMGRPKGKLLLHCVLIITSVVPAELPMELSMAVNASLLALSRFAIFCTEPFRIPYAGRVDVCCFDKTGTITGEDLEVQGVVGSSEPSSDRLELVTQATPETTLVLAAAHALVIVDNDVVGDPMEKRTVEAIGWEVKRGDNVVPTERSPVPKHHAVHIRLRFHFSSALKRMSTVAQVTLGGGKKSMLASVKGAPETLRSMFSRLPPNYDALYRDYTRRGSRVIALGYKYMDHLDANALRNVRREDVESQLQFAGFLVLHCPLKPDAIESLRQLNDSAHRCVMITGDNALTAVHIAEEVEIIARDALILDRREGGAEHELVWRKTNDEVARDQNADAPLHRHLFDEYDVVVTGAALRVYEDRPEALRELVENTSVYARVSPTQKELVLSTLKSLKYITLMAGDGTNDVGALKMANIGVALLDGSPEDLKKIAQHQMNERQKKMYEAQLSLTARWGQPPPPVPPALKEAYPQLEEAREKAASQLAVQRRTNPVAKFDMSSITQSMSAMDAEDDGPPQIRLGDASVAAPFTSKLSNVTAICSIIRQGRCTLVATVQMYKILALNCLIQAYALSAQYIDGIRSGDYQLTVSGVLASVCFYCISRGQPIESLAPERPVSNIVNLYVFGSVLTQTALHVLSMMYVQRVTLAYETPVQPEEFEIAGGKFTPTLLNTGVFLLGLSQTMSTFVVNYIGRPWRESIQENKVLYYGLLSATGVAYLGAIEALPELNEWLQLTKMEPSYQRQLLAAMFADLVGCYVVERFWKLFADVKPRKMVRMGQQNRAARRALLGGAPADKKHE